MKVKFTAVTVILPGARPRARCHAVVVVFAPIPAAAVVGTGTGWFLEVFVMPILGWLGEKLGLVKSAQENLVSDAVTQLEVVGAVTRAHTRHQIEEYLRGLEASGQTELAAKVRGELSAAGLLPGEPPAVTVQPVTPAATPIALPPSPPTTPAPAPAALPAPRKRGRPRKNPSPGEPFRPGTAP